MALVPDHEDQTMPVTRRLPSAQVIAIWLGLWTTVEQS